MSGRDRWREFKDYLYLALWAAAAAILAVLVIVLSIAYFP